MNKDVNKNARFRKRRSFIWQSVTIGLLIFGAMLAWTAYVDYENTLSQEYRTLESQARLGDVQIAGALRSIDLMLQSVVDDAKIMPKIPAQVIKQRHQNWLRQFPEIQYLNTVNSHGQTMTAESLNNADNLAAVRSFNAAQREYFTIHRDAKPEDYSRYQLSRPFKAITNRHTITISRAIRAENGEFLGVALASLSASYFDFILQQVLSNGVLDAAALHNRFGDIIYRLPNPDKYIGKNISEGDAFKAYLRSDQHFTRYFGVTITDNVKRILVFSKVEGTNLDIGVSGQYDVVMHEWIINLLVKVLTFIIVMGLSLTLAWEIQRRVLARQASDKAEERFRAYFERSMVGMATINPKTEWIDVNPALCEILGYSIDELLTKTWGQLSHPQDLATEQLQLDRIFSGEIDEFEMDKRCIHRQGNTLFIRLAVRAGRKPDMTVDYMVAILEDITERKLAEGKIHQQAFHDILTALPNRRLLNDRLSQAMVASQRSGRYCALMFLDLDNFKPLNDTHGHDAGDALLLELADRLRSCVRAVDTVARFGGDEFVVVLSELTSDSTESRLQAGTVAEKIRAKLSESYLLAIKNQSKTDCTVEHRCTASIGVVIFMNHQASQHDILKWADDAMYQAKNAGRNLVRFHERSDQF